MGGFLSSIMERWGKFYRRSSIQVILSLSFTAVAVAGMIFLGLTLFLRFSASNNAQLAKNSQRVLAQVNLNLDAYLRGMMRVSDTMYYRVIKNADLDSDSLDAQMALLYESNRDSLVSIAVFAQSGELVSATPLATLKKSVSPQRQDWFAAAVDRIENLHFSTPHVQNLFEDPDYRYRWVVSLSRQVELTRAGSIEGGVLLVDMSFSGIEQICKDVELASSDGYLYLIDGDGEIIYHPRQQLIYAGLLEENNRTAAGYEDGSHAETFGGAKRQVTVKTVGYTGWKLVGVVPADNIWDNYGQLLLFFLFVVLFSIFLLVFVNLHLSERISVPIKTLERAVKELEAGREEVDIDVSGPYEIERLGHSIRSMVSTMRHLMDDIIEQEAQKRRSELDVLQSQINPHFLYNTLDSVVWMTENGRTDEAILMVTSLARFFRISLSRGSNIIPIADELEHARHYLTIQKMRYNEKLRYEIDLDPQTEDCLLPKLILQPLVENAIYHGIKVKQQGGTVRIESLLEEDRLLITVEDDGIGMTPEQLETILDKKESDAESTKIGVYNVNERLQLFFGPDAVMKYYSTPGKRTMVMLVLPIVREKEENSHAEG